MTSIVCNIFKSGTNNPLDGYIEVTAEASFTDDLDKYFVPVTQRFTLVSGSVTFDLSPSDVAKVSYKFNIYENVPDEVIEGEPVEIPDRLVRSFYALVPQSVTPINIKDLAAQTGLRYDLQDSSLLTLSRYLATSNTFWDSLNNNIWVHRGDYLPDTFYKRGDIVIFNGSSYQYVAQEATENNVPTSATFWRLLSSKGDSGTGTDGNDEAYGISWNGSLDAPSRNAVYDIVQTLATQAQLALKANLSSPNFTDNPTAPTPTTGDRSSKLATTNFVGNEINLLDQVPVGTILIWGTSSAPSRARVLTNPGEVVSRTTYSELFALYGTTYNTGGEAGTVFRLPSSSTLPTLSSPNMRYIVFTGV